MGLAHMDFLQSLMYTAIGLVVGGVATFFWTKRKFEKELKENPSFQCDIKPAL